MAGRTDLEASVEKRRSLQAVDVSAERAIDDLEARVAQNLVPVPVAMRKQRRQGQQLRHTHYQHNGRDSQITSFKKSNFNLFEKYQNTDCVRVM